MSQSRKVLPYIWLLVIFCVLGVGHVLFFRFSFHPLNPFPITRGLAFGSALWSTVLVVSMAFRLGWARYVLSAWLVLAMSCFSLVVLQMNKLSSAPISDATQEAVFGLVLYALGLIPLGLSHTLRRFLAPRTAGGN